MNGHAILRLAEAIATVAHDGQSRKGAGEPYIEHPRRVVEAVMGWQAKSVAWLHDVVEDTSVSPISLLNVGIPSEIVDAVRALTREDSSGTYMEHIRDQVKPNELARYVKLADLRDNLHDLDELPPKYQSMRRRYERAILILEEEEESVGSS